MLLAIFGIVDVILGGVLAASPFVTYSGAGIIAVLAAVAIIKGLYSVVTAAGGGFYFDLLGWLDLIVGVLLFLATGGVKFNWFLWIGIFMVAKGVYSIAIEMVGD